MMSNSPMFCPNCSTENPADARFCSHCATPLAALICGRCGGGNRAAARFCSHCGLGLVLVCPNCGASPPHPAAAFCDQCGFDLGLEADEPAIHQTESRPVSSRRVQPMPLTVPEGRRARPVSRAVSDQAASGLGQLGRYIPQELMRKLEAAQAGGSMIGERRVVTMLFCDVTGSTAAAEKLDPEEWTEIINGAFERMIRPVYRYEGTLARLMGDAILAFFGAPIAHEDDPQRAILAGLEIVESIKPYVEEIGRRFDIDLGVRVGINTGRVVVGAMGSDLRMEYTAMGDAVNLAARMEQTADPGTVQVAEETYRLTSPLFDFEALGPVEVKGKSGPVQVYRVAGRKAASGRIRGIEGQRAPLIGRDSEWSRLTEAAEGIRQGVGQIVFLVGEAGLGKSRLIEELREEVGRGQWAGREIASGGSANGDSESAIPDPQSAVNWFETASMSYETAQPYSLFQRLLRRVLGAAETETVGVLREKLSELVSDAPEEEQEALGQVAEALLGLPAADGRPPLKGEAFKGLLYTVSTTLWRRIASERPTILVCDDLHWTDPASAGLLEHLLSLADESPLMFLAATRSDRDAPGWALKQAAGEAYPHRTTEINVRPLTAEDSNELVNCLLTIAELPDSLRARIQAKAEGNPFFVEEVVRTLIDTGCVVPTSDGLRWQAIDGGQNIDIPDNLQSLLTARMDRLAENTKQILQLAALIGRSFYYRLLKHIVDGELGRAAAELDLELNNLQRADLIREASRLPELEYMFRHSLTQEAAYRTILRKQRTTYHQRVGETIEALYPDQLAENAPALAHHFDESGDAGRAFRYGVMAGDEAFRLFAHAEALAHYGRAAELVEASGAGTEQIIRLYTRRGRALELSLDYDGAVASYEKLAALAEERDEPRFRLAALNLQATAHAVYSPVHEPVKALALAGEALGLARQLGDRSAEARALWNRSMANQFSGIDRPAALVDGEASLAIARELDLREQMAYTLHNLAQTYRYLGRDDDALAVVEESRELFRAMNDLPMLASSYLEVITVVLSRGDIEGATRLQEEAYRISKAIGNEWNSSLALTMKALILTYQGELGEALDLLDDAVNIIDAEKLPETHLLVLTFVKGMAQAFLANNDAVRASSEEILAWAEHMPPSFAWNVRNYVALICSLIGETEQVGSILATEPPAGEVIAASFVAPSRLLARAIHNARTLSAEEAMPSADDLLAAAREAHAELHIPWALWLRARLLAKLGRDEAAREALREGLEIARHLNERPVIQRLLDILVPLVEDPAEREALAAEHQDVIDFIADHAGSEENRRIYLASVGADQ